MRLNRFLSLCGLGSRRGSEEIVRAGRVAVNGQPVSDLATQVKEGDEVSVDGRRVHAKAGVVIVLHKPKGYLCTREDTHERSTIYDLLPKKFHTLHHVGRLDQDSEGLILLTNRGELSQRLLHPSEGVEKEYSVRLETEFEPTDIPKLLHGVMTPEGFAKAERAWVENKYVLNVVLKQGLKRQIRLMFYGLGYEVERLIRTRIGGLKLYGLPKGDWRELTDAEVERHFQKRESRPASVSKARAAKDRDSDDHFAPSTAVKRASRKSAAGPRKPRRSSKPGQAGGSSSASSAPSSGPRSRSGTGSRSYPRPDKESSAPASAARKYGTRSQDTGKTESYPSSSKKTPAARKYGGGGGKSGGYPSSRKAPTTSKGSVSRKGPASRQGPPARKHVGLGGKKSDGKYHR